MLKSVWARKNDIHEERSSSATTRNFEFHKKKCAMKNKQKKNGNSAEDIRQKQFKKIPENICLIRFPFIFTDLFFWKRSFSYDFLLSLQCFRAM